MTSRQRHKSAFSIQRISSFGAWTFAWIAGAGCVAEDLQGGPPVEELACPGMCCLSAAD